MNITVIGAGIVGLTTAWYLQRDGHRVTVVDRREHVGLGSSMANGGQLSYRYVAPLADPEILARIPGW
ncbi:MAG: FAD-dependent oxidoreductase, partial [Rhodocyclaceae bacterium]|nr:FAD-dependent oxidoreductase [Rhodocyclaceae bacterium]